MMMKPEDVMRAVEEWRKHGLNNGGALGYHAGWCDEVADLLENALALLREKDAEIERLTEYNENLISANIDITYRHKEYVEEAVRIAKRDIIKEFYSKYCEKFDLGDLEDYE